MIISAVLPLRLLLPPASTSGRECYYWDSYWVVRGLLASGLHAAAQGIVENLLHLLDQQGCVPNGARSYYLNRRWDGA